MQANEALKATRKELETERKALKNLSKEAEQIRNKLSRLKGEVEAQEKLLTQNAANRAAYEMKIEKTLEEIDNIIAVKFITP